MGWGSAVVVVAGSVVVVVVVEDDVLVVVLVVVVGPVDDVEVVDAAVVVAGAGPPAQAAGATSRANVRSASPARCLMDSLPRCRRGDYRPGPAVPGNKASQHRKETEPDDSRWQSSRVVPPGPDPIGVRAAGIRICAVAKAPHPSSWWPYVGLVAAALLTAAACTSEGSLDSSMPPTTPETTAGNTSASTIPPTTPSAAGCPSGSFVPVTHRRVLVPPPTPEPEPRVWYQEPTFGTCLMRLTDREGDLSPEDPSSGLRHEYARVQAFNADGSFLLLQGTEGTHYLYDATTLQPITELALGAEPRWDAEDPDLLFFTEDTALRSYRVSSGATETIRDFAGDLAGHNPVVVWTAWEGSPSIDRRYWALMAENDEWLPTAFLFYDRAEDRIDVLDLRGVPGVEDDVDHVTTSPLGTYLLASFDRACESGTTGTGSRPCGLMVYDRNLQEARGLLRVLGHYDTALDATGNEVIVYQDIDTDRVSMLDLGTGAVTPLLDIDFSFTGIGVHVSGLGYDRPGWAVISTHDNDTTSHTWIDDQVFLVELKADGRVLRLAHTYSTVDDEQELDYWAEPHATTNPDITRILFASNRGRSGTGKVDAYLIALPAEWSENLP